jgi:asparagine synthetase B (glutamine-hydrolysing)
MWNGELFGGSVLQDYSNSNQKSDTLAVWGALQKEIDSTGSFEGIIRIFTSDALVLEGPYAFVYYHASSRRIIFGRDPLGRRSMLWGYMNDSHTSKSCFFLTSSYIAEDKPNSQLSCLSELPVDGVFSINLDEITLDISKSDNDPSAPWHKYPRSSPFSSNMYTTTSDTLESSIKLLYQMLHDAVRKRVTMVDRDNVRIGILFSGGLDSAIITSLVDHILPIDYQIDIINVAFENSRWKPLDTLSEAFPFHLVPDRMTAMACMEQDFGIDLKNENQKRWNWIPVNVTIEEQNEYKRHICNLMAPCNTQMDWSIAAPFWFASRAASQETKILLCGFGADELFGGYTRHRTHYNQGGWSSLEAELKKDLERMWIRNLGRDDRMLSDHGRESRCPFLDESLIKTVLYDIPIGIRIPWETADKSTSDTFIKGHDDKYLLRQLAKQSLGLSFSANLPKRAIQFGCKSAKSSLGQGKQKGTDIISLL